MVTMRCASLFTRRLCLYMVCFTSLVFVLRQSGYRLCATGGWLTAVTRQCTPLTSTRRRHRRDVSNAEAPVLRHSSGACSKGVDILRDIDVQDVAWELYRFIEARQRHQLRHPLANPETLPSLAQEFALWYLVRQLKPAHVVEVGAWQEMGARVVHDALPGVKVVLVDPGQRHVGFADPASHAIYQLGGKHNKEFKTIDWHEKAGVDLARALVVFHDGVSHVQRVAEARYIGFTHVVFMENGARMANTSMTSACEALLSDNRTASDTVAASVWNDVQTYFQFPSIWSEHSPSLHSIINNMDSILQLEDEPDLSRHYGNIAYAELHHKSRLKL